MSTDLSVFDAIRRGYKELEISTNEEIVGYFSDIPTKSIFGHVNNIKGILFEQLYVDQLAAQGISASIFEATNHPVSDISIYDGEILINQLQLKATDSVSYITSTLKENPEIGIVTTSEVAAHFDPGVVIDSGIENFSLSNAVHEKLFEETVIPMSPLSIIGWIFGLHF